ncbi:glycosyltransferase family 2 protein [Pedobacter heparinus]|uniref:Glycosyl transferase family 2 n=1 Tax=Pedobacter heparinus (strain ATCC 13125 / DSM 2366 / CIP 104194 / JCM 7457 / NBRC 12017 / NCIMB 9290 / NRRL B-14731 / HIM 762-3) TaxID=485917 RepID=C6XVM4_PEDHD|nr:glycosyltransferase family 2 protein [Pedobacter heparinus]ACU06099.1 glycosyl transferase family 2 [Pedobacter heparinus DSM 2366]
MLNPHYTFIILTYNEETHLPRLLNSIYELNAAVCILDSGSTDHTMTIAATYNAQIKQHPFKNHPWQWHHALSTFDIKTPWVIGLDADQVISDELSTLLLNFRDEDYADVSGIYFNRKNYFKGRWLKYGGYYPFYLLKMFRYGIGYSDLSENMDHRFIVPGKTIIWKNAYLLEENLKENQISFWIDKHNRYSDLLAQEEIERRKKLRIQTIKASFWGTPDQRTARLKQMWWRMPLFIRPVIYFIYRYIFRLGILDGYAGFIFHFMQAFWFRLVVDIKIKELLDNEQTD